MIIASGFFSAKIYVSAYLGHKKEEKGRPRQAGVNGASII